MAATYCLGGFAQAIRKLPREQWKAELDALPEKCPHGCGVDCRPFCTAFARVQWRMAVMREQNGRKAA